MSSKKSRMSEHINGAVNKYISRRKLDTKRARCVSIAEMIARSVVTSAASTNNLVIFSTTNIDYTQTEQQYTAFKFWISESEDHFKPELAQLLYQKQLRMFVPMPTTDLYDFKGSIEFDFSSNNNDIEEQQRARDLSNT